jgi:gamma-glutamylcyclotransferase
VVLYFAYGSNLDQAQLQRRCPEAFLVSVGSLPDYRLAFTIHSTGWNAGAADVVASVGDRVWGLVFQLTEDDLYALDRCEGYPEHYTRFLASIETTAGIVDAWTYTALRKQEFVRPSRRYMDLIREAALRHGFPEGYVRMLDRIPVVEE